MKISKVLLWIICSVFLSVSISSCGGSSASHEDTEKQGKAYTSAYVCPMHCDGSGSDTPGKCPVCDMDYIKNEDAKDHGHSH